MKYYILKEIAQYLTRFTTINHIKRVSNNTIKIEFNDRKTLYFDMVKGGATVYIKDSKDINSKVFNAPVDVVLQKRFNNSRVEKVFLRNDDKVLNIICKSKSSYKEQTTILQLEFTGKNTNIIILDENDIVLEALRHIDEWTSVRIVKVGQRLNELEKPNFIYEEKDIYDIESYLLDLYNSRIKKELESLKKQKIIQLNKHIKKIDKILKSLEDVDSLESKSINLNNEAIEIVGKLYELQGYEKSLNIQKSNDMFRDSKKAKAKAKNQYIEKINLTQKYDFYNRLINSINSCKTIDEVEFYFPKKDKNQIKTKKANPYQSFFINGYKIMLGRDERENIYLLQNSKASDFWFHLQGQVSSHVIVSNTKKTIPENIIEEAAKICAKFSLDSGGVYSVDFTQRRNVKIQTKANVLYNPYSTVVVKV
ncbi:MAG: NFACT RNA binding domain-containing protein [Campylobacterota bacterium]|nr:NFACT RNA binding domain-containing protein [Campylobacterota bacterium]